MFILLVLIMALSLMPATASGASGVDQILQKVDLAFERNQGQVDPQVQFLARGQGYGLFLTKNEAVMRFTTPKPAVVRMRFPGQQQNVKVEGLHVLDRTTNYLLGDRSSQRPGILSYKKVRYSEVYSGIDLEYHGTGKLLEYDFIVKPGANPRKIRMAFSGVRGLSLEPSGDLVLKTDAEPLVQKKPHVYQEIDGHQQTIEAAYQIHGNEVGFRIGEYDRTRPLIIDPVLIYSTFFGGTGTEIAYGIAVDTQGSVYVAGATTSTDFPTASAFQSAYKDGSLDAFVFKLDPSASQIVYSTYIGGAGTDEAHAIAVDAGGNASITGFTQSNDFPIVNGFQKTRAGEREAYLLRLNSSGTDVVFSTYLGGTSDDRGFSIALDPGNNAYVTGTTGSSNFPVSNAYQPNFAGGFADAFVVKVSAAGSLVYSTYVGGIGNDNPLGIAVDGIGGAYVTGWTTSVNFPMVNAFQSKFGRLDVPVGTDDVFVFKLAPSGGTLEYSTYVGGTGSDEGTRIAVDSLGSAYVTGYTGSLDFPTVKPYQLLLAEFSSGVSTTGLDAFLFKMAPDGKSLVYSTYFGGFQPDSGTGIAVDSTGAAYVSGYTSSFDLPTANEVQGFISGDRDAFIAKFDPSGAVLVFSTFLGGSGTDGATGLTVDAARNVYVVGFTTSGDFRTEKPLQEANAGGQEVFVAKMNAEDIVSSSQFQVAPQGASSVVTKGTRTDAVFGYAVAEPVVPGTELTGLSIISRKQNGATVSEVGAPAPPLTQSGRLFVDVTTTGQAVVSIANASDQDATVDFFYTDATGTTSQYATATVKAHEHFSRFITGDPFNIFAPGTLNYTSSIPVAVSSFNTVTNEAGELLISLTPIVEPVKYSQEVGNKPVAIPELAEGGGWRGDIVLVNPSEDRMNGEVHFLTQGAGDQPGVPLEIGIGDEAAPASVVEFDIPGRGFQKISTAGTAVITDVPFAINRGVSVRTPGAGPFQTTGFASIESTDPQTRLNGLEMIEYRQGGVTQSQTGILAPVLRQTGRFFAELTDRARPFMAIANPNTEDLTIEVFLTDDAGTSSAPATVLVPAGGQFSVFLSEQPIGLALNSARTVTFNSPLPVFVTALRFFTNERSDALLSAIPIVDTPPIDGPLVIPHFADGAGWKTEVVLVNNTEEELRGEVRFMSQGSSSEPPHGVDVGTAEALTSVFEYHIQPRSYFRVQTNGLLENLSTGSVHIVPFGGHTPAANAVVAQFVVDENATAIAGTTRVNTIFETPVEARLPAMSLRFYGESAGDFDAGKPRSTRTSLAVANPSGAETTFQLEVTSFDNVSLGTSSPITIPAGGQYANYLQLVPGLESLPVPFQGLVRLNVLSGSGVTAASFRVLRNERLDYLVTTTGPLNEDAGMPGRLVFPYLTDSAGYTSQFILFNPPGVQSGSGVVFYRGTDGTPLGVEQLKLGSVRVIPFAGYNTPHAHIVLHQRQAGILSSIIGIEGQLPGRAFRMYAESLGDFQSGANGSTRSGVALANPSDEPASVVVEMRTLEGTLVRTSRPLAVPPNGEVALFLNDIPGLETLPVPFEGVSRIVATSPQGITASGFRILNNERGETIITTTGPLSENAGSPDQLVFPHIAEGGGYTTQFIVIGGVSGQGNAGVLRFFNEAGSPLNLTLTTR